MPLKCKLFILRMVNWIDKELLLVSWNHWLCAIKWIIEIIIIIVNSRCQHGSPWPSSATRLYRPSLPVGLQGYILYWHRAVVYRFSLVVQPLLVHVKGSTWVSRLWVRSYFCSSIPHVWWGLASDTRSILLTAFLCNCCQAFSPSV